MVGSLGPRVGGAHVDVNLKFDDNSLSTVGKQIHRQLSSLSKSLSQVGDRNRNVYQAIGRDAVTAWRAALGAAVSAAPLIGSAISALSGSATMLAGSLYSVSQSAGAAFPLLTSMGIAGITASIGMRNFGAAVSEVDPDRLQLLLKDMPKSMQAAVMSTRAMSKEMRAVIWEKLFVGIEPLMNRLRETGVIQRGLGKMATSINGLVRGVLRYAGSANGVSTLNKFFNNNAKVFAALSKAAVPFLDGFLKLINALTPAAIRLAGRITDIGKRFQSWTSAAGFGKRVDDSMKGAEKTSGLLFKTLGNLGSAIRNIFNAANPATNTFLEMLVAVTQRFEDWTASVGGRNSIAEWAMNSVDVMRQFGNTIEAVFKVIAELADPRVISSFLKTVEEAFNYLGKLPLDKIVDGFVRIAESLQPVSSLFLAIIIGGAALNVMIGSLIGQLGGLFSIFTKLIKFKILTTLLKNIGGGAGSAGGAAAGAAKKTGLLSRAWGLLLAIINKVKSAFSTVIGFFTKTSSTTASTASKVGTLGKAFKPVMSILSRFVKFAGPVGIAVWIGTIIAKSKDLQKKLGEVWNSVKGVGSALGDAFSEIGTALKPLAPVAKGVGKAIGPIFGFLDKLMGLAIGLFLDTLKYAFDSLASAIRGAGKVIAGIINIFSGFFLLFKDPGKGLKKMWDGLKQLASGIGPLLKGIFGLFVTFFAPAKLGKIAFGAIKGLGGGLLKAAPTILKTVGSFLVKVLKFFATLTPRLIAFGIKTFLSLGQAFLRALPSILSAVGRIVGGILKWIATLPGKLLSLGGKALAALLKAVVKNTPKVLNAARKILIGIVNWIVKLPGRLLSLGKKAIEKLGGAVRAGIPLLKEIAGKIFKAVVDWIVKLPGRLFELGKKTVTKLKNALGDGVKKVKSAAKDIFNAIWDAIKGLPEDMFGLGKKIVEKIAKGITSGIDAVKKGIGKVTSTIGKFLPGSPVREGPLMSWNHGNDATGGGRNVIDAITGGLRDISPINRAMRDVASAVSTSMLPRTAGRVQGESSSTPTTNTRPGLSINIDTVRAHDYKDFMGQMQRRERSLALGGLG